MGVINTIQASDEDITQGWREINNNLPKAFDWIGMYQREKRTVVLYIVVFLLIFLIALDFYWPEKLRGVGEGRWFYNSWWYTSGSILWPLSFFSNFLFLFYDCGDNKRLADRMSEIWYVVEFYTWGVVIFSLFFP